jgi:hypothetical protein
LYSVLLRVYFVILRKFLLHCFGAFELLQKIFVAPRDGLLHRFFIGTPQLLSDCFSNGLERNNRLFPREPLFPRIFSPGLPAAGAHDCSLFHGQATPVSPRGYYRGDKWREC